MWVKRADTEDSSSYPQSIQFWTAVLCESLNRDRAMWVKRADTEDSSSYPQSIQKGFFLAAFRTTSERCTNVLRESRASASLECAVHSTAL
jgi:hypothetical protein